MTTDRPRALSATPSSGGKDEAEQTAAVAAASAAVASASVGDFRGALAKLRSLMRQVKFPPHMAAESRGGWASTAQEEVELEAGAVGPLLPVLHFALVQFSPSVKEFLQRCGYDFDYKTDRRFVEEVWKFLTQQCRQKPQLTPHQFLAPSGFGEKKLLLCCCVLSVCRAIHNATVERRRLLQTSQQVAHRRRREASQVPELSFSQSCDNSSSSPASAPHSPQMTTPTPCSRRERELLFRLENQQQLVILLQQQLAALSTKTPSPPRRREMQLQSEVAALKAQISLLEEESRSRRSVASRVVRNLENSSRLSPRQRQSSPHTAASRTVSLSPKRSASEERTQRVDVSSLAASDDAGSAEFASLSAGVVQLRESMKESFAKLRRFCVTVTDRLESLEERLVVVEDLLRSQPPSAFPAQQRAQETPAVSTHRRSAGVLAGGLVATATEELRREEATAASARSASFGCAASSISNPRTTEFIGDREILEVQSNNGEGRRTRQAGIPRQKPPPQPVRQSDEAVKAAVFEISRRLTAAQQQQPQQPQPQFPQGQEQEQACCCSPRRARQQPLLSSAPGSTMGGTGGVDAPPRVEEFVACATSGGQPPPTSAEQRTSVEERKDAGALRARRRPETERNPSEHRPASSPLQHNNPTADAARQADLVGMRSSRTFDLAENAAAGVTESGGTPSSMLETPYFGLGRSGSTESSDAVSSGWINENPSTAALRSWQFAIPQGR